MTQRTALLILFALCSLCISGCVSSGKYQLKEQEAQGLTAELGALKTEYAKLQSANETLRGEKLLLEKDLSISRKESDDLLKAKNKLIEDNREIDSMLKAKSDSFSQLATELREKNQQLQQQNADLEKQIDRLKQEIAKIQKAKEEEVQKTSSTYESLLASMKNEIAQGQVTISELKGKLTVNVVDAVLFDSGKAEVKKDGLTILLKVIDILKDITGKAIRIEGHTDNVQIRGALTHKFPTNWELSAARAINVTRYLQSQGIDPAILSAVAYGEYKPVSPNDTDEGKAKNRRIEIILVPKEQ